MSPDEHISTACGLAGDFAAADKPVVVGEWSGALTDCALWLNGRFKGARYDGSFAGETPVGSCQGKSTGSVNGLSGDDKSNIARYNAAQIQAYEAKSGWVIMTVPPYYLDRFN